MTTSTRVELICRRCGGGYTRHASNAENSKYCSNACRYGWDHELPIEERTPRNSEYYQNRKKALRRDQFRCQQCRWAEHDVDRLVVHHKTPIRYGGTHAVRNLETLCHSCHAKVHAKHHPELLQELKDAVENIEE